jgi:serine/threonine-protein kinase
MQSAPTGRRANEPAVAAGDVLGGRWRVTKKLGQGGMGAVYEAEHVDNGRRAAVKVMLPTLASEGGYRQMFAREALVDNAVDAASRPPAPAGPGAVQVYDSGETRDGSPFVVMELLQGKPVDHALRSGLRDPGFVRVVLDEGLGVLEGAHDQGIVHRDLKPENMFVTDGLHVHVLDWGLAQLPGDGAWLGSPSGTLGYAPPEQVVGLPATPASDVWGMGATAYALSTGRLPVGPDRQVAYLEKLDTGALRDFSDQIRGVEDFDLAALGCPVPPIRSVAPDTPPDLARVIDRALQCRPEDRYPDARAMREDLLRAVDEELARQRRP